MIILNSTMSMDLKPSCLACFSALTCWFEGGPQFEFNCRLVVGDEGTGKAMEAIIVSTMGCNIKKVSSEPSELGRETNKPVQMSPEGASGLPERPGAISRASCRA